MQDTVIQLDPNSEPCAHAGYILLYAWLLNTGASARRSLMLHRRAKQLLDDIGWFALSFPRIRQLTATESRLGTIEFSDDGDFSAARAILTQRQGRFALVISSEIYAHMRYSIAEHIERKPGQPIYGLAVGSCYTASLLHLDLSHSLDSHDWVVNRLYAETYEEQKRAAYRRKFCFYATCTDWGRSSFCRRFAKRYL